MLPHTLMADGKSRELGVLEQLLEPRRKQTELVIHRPNGQIRDKDSHGSDPYPPQG